MRESNRAPITTLSLHSGASTVGSALSHFTARPRKCSLAYRPLYVCVCLCASLGIYSLSLFCTYITAASPLRLCVSVCLAGHSRSAASKIHATLISLAFSRVPRSKMNQRDTYLSSYFTYFQSIFSTLTTPPPFRPTPFGTLSGTQRYINPRVK